MTEAKTTQQPRGNTKARGFAFTLWSEEDVKEWIKWSAPARFACVGAKELTLERKEHWHAYAYFNNERSFNAIKKALDPKTHIEICRKPLAYIDYCYKEGKLYEDGDPPGKGIDILHMTKEEIIKADPRCHRAYLKAKDTLESEQKKNEMIVNLLEGNLKMPDFYYFQGDTGRGKTHGAFLKAKEKGYKPEDIGIVRFDEKFILGDVDKKCLICMEFRPSCVHPSVLLEVTDKYGHLARIFGDYKYIKPECIILCSIIPLKELYKKEELNEQFTRRCKEVIDLGYAKPFKPIGDNTLVI